LKDKKIVKITGLIAEAKIKRLASQDIGGRVIVDFNITDPEVMADLTRFAQAEAEVIVAIAEIGR
jgi:hypothetical protein